MAEVQRSKDGFNPWKLTTFGILIVLATALITGVVVANYGHEAADDVPVKTSQASAPAKAAAKPVVVAEAKRPSASDIDACNRAADEARRTTGDTIKDALIGAGAGAGLGAAGGAIADGGKGAGKGAGIGGLVGAAAGTLYGLNKNNQNDQNAAQAYRDCMQARGFS